ncbi:MAG: ATP-binding protein [Bacteroidota bacterium]
MINKATIYNYRSCLETEVELHPELTILIGANAAGKTNILQALYLFPKINRTNRAMPQSLSNFDGHIRSTIELNLTISNDRNYKLKGDILYVIDEYNEDHIQVATIAYKSDINRAKYRSMNFDLQEQAYYFHDYKGDYPFPDKEEFEESLPIVRAIQGISYYSASQFANPRGCPISVKPNELIFSKENIRKKGHSDFIKELYKSSQNNPETFQQYLFLIGKEGLELVEEINFNVQQFPNASFGNKIVVTPSVSIDGVTISFNQLSDGTFRTLALIFYIISDENEVLLIEEPEISVHHGLLLSIMELIKQESKRKQIVISTHSDLVLDRVAPENVLLVSKDKEEGTLAKPLSKSMSENEYKELKEYLETEGNLGEYWRETGWEYE